MMSEEEFLTYNTMSYEDFLKLDIKDRFRLVVRQYKN